MSKRFQLLKNTTSLAVIAGAMALSSTASAGSLPSHGHFVSGQGTIGKANQSVTVKQSSTTGIINWNSFSIGKHSAVIFDNASGATLNRVTGGNLSRIAGSLHATGSLYLLNSSGVIVSGTGKVLTGGNFAASSGNITDAFGDSRFKTGTARIVNKGTITAGGSVKLNGSAVGDAGRIRATQIDLQASRKLDIAGGLTARTERGAGGSVTARALVIDVSGHVDVSATRAHATGGSVSIVARDTAAISGTIAANGGAHGTGGFIETSGKHLHIADSAKISTLARHGATGTWLLDPQDFTIAPSGGDITGATLSTNLATADVDIESSNGANAGNGDIFVDDTVSWSSNHTLTLDAYRNINIEAPVTVSGGGGLAIVYGDVSGTGVGDSSNDDGYLLINGGNISFTGGSGAGATLSIDAASYTLLYSMSDVQNINANATALQGDYALATSLDATSTTGWVPIGTNGTGTVTNNGFSGVFEGLGNTISNLTIDIGSNDLAGLFGVSTGMIRDVGLIGGSVSGRDFVGGLVGENEPSGILGIVNSYTTGTVNGRNYVGGLVGLNAADNDFDDDGYAVAAISDSYATGSVSGSEYVGGLVGADGENEAHGGDAVAGSYATGDVMGTEYVGGLVGENDQSRIDESYATGTVNGSGDYVGGLTGANISGGKHSYIEASYATGAVSGGDMVGGLVGDNDGGTIKGAGASYATGSVTGNDDVGGLIGVDTGTIDSFIYATGSVRGADNVGGLIGDSEGNSFPLGYATGAVSGGSDVGGLVGNNGSDEKIDASYATGSVSGSGTDVGGLVGSNSGEIEYSYAIGSVGGSADNAGGLVGSNDGTVKYSYAIGMVSGSADVGGLIGLDSGSVVHSYFDTQTSGIGATQGAGNVASAAGITGLTTAKFQSGLPSDFSDQDWYIVAGASFPYLTWQYTVSAPQVVSGKVLSGYGGTGVSGVTVTALENGVTLASTLTGGAVTSYADGYYYYLLAPGTIGSGDNVVTYRTGSAAMSDIGGSVSGLNLYGDYLDEVTGDADYSTVKSDLASAIGGNSAAQTIVNGLDNLAIDATGASFNIDSAIDLGTGALVVTSAGTITQSGAGAIDALSLTGSSVGAAKLNIATNVITDLGSFDTGGDHKFELTDAHHLVVDGAINTGAHGIYLATKGAGHGIAIDATLKAKNVKLTSASTITEGSAGDIDATTLRGASVGDITLNIASNDIADLGSFTTGGNHRFALTDAHDLVVDGAINSGTHGIYLVTKGSGHGIAVDAMLKATTVKLTSAAGIAESGAGDIDAEILTGSSVGITKITSTKNTVADLGTFSTGGNHAFSLTDDHNLTVNGEVSAGTGVLDLTTVGSEHNLTIASALTGGTMNFVTTGKATETKMGAITAKLLNVTANTGIELTSQNNAIKKLGTDKTKTGPNKVTL